jgi:hypothetical protein
MSHLRNISKIFARNRTSSSQKKTRTNMSHFVALPAIFLPHLRLHYSSFSPSGGQAQWWPEQQVAVRQSQSVGKQWLYPPLVRFSTGEFRLFTLMVADGRGEGDGARSRRRSLHWHPQARTSEIGAWPPLAWTELGTRGGCGGGGAPSLGPLMIEEV